MGLLADILLVAGTLAVAAYCYVLSARLRKFATLESGMGSAVALLSAQVDDMTRALDRARGSAQASATGLETLTARAEMAAARMEVLLASMHDLPSAPERAAESRPLRFVRRKTTRAVEEDA
ncbi:MAG: hypothetical protein WAK98_15210 [Gemmobacter sp.]|jgi:hypothetical protein